MNFTTITAAQRTAADIEQITADTISFVEARLNQLHSLSSDPDVLAVFGTNAVSALTMYSAFLQALSAVKPDHSAPTFDPEIFQPQPDGSVVYAAPPTQTTPPIPDEPITLDLI
jgi:hypothetical protein